MRKSIVTVKLIPAQQAALKALADKGKAPVRKVKRASMLLEGFAGKKPQETAKQA